MKRKLFTILAAVSLLLGVMFAALCGRSFFASDELSFRKYKTIRDGEIRSWLSVHSERGILWIEYRHDELSDPSLLRRGTSDIPGLHFAPGPARWRADVNFPHATVLQQIGLQFQAGQSMYSDYREIVLPLWVVTLLFFGLSIPLLRRFVPHRANVDTSELCSACGYDLRATPQRCPECGAVPQVLPPMNVDAPG